LELKVIRFREMMVMFFSNNEKYHNPYWVDDECFCAFSYNTKTHTGYCFFNPVWVDAIVA